MQIFDSLIVGAGIAGLSAAWDLAQIQGETNILVLEQNSHVGGKIITRISETAGGRVIVDGGPESFVTRKPEVWDLAHALGLGDRLVQPFSETSKMYVLHDGRPIRVPLDPIRFFTSDIMTLRGKLRMLAEPLVKARRDDGDESLADFVSRRLGHEALERFIGPVLGGIYNANPERQSILYTAPVMREIEQEHGGLFVGSLARMRRRKAENAANGAKPVPRFVAFQNGSQELVEALQGALAGKIRVNSQIVRITQRDEAYEISLQDGATIVTRSLIMATPANAAADLLQEVAPEAARKLQTIQHSSIGTITLVFRSEDLPATLDMRGLMIPRKEHRAIDALTWTSERLPGRAPQGITTLRAFFGGSQPETIALSDAALLEAVLGELRALLGIHATPSEAIAFRWPSSYPSAQVGHLDLVAQIEAELPQSIQVAGSSYRGLGVPDCIRQGRDAAQAVAQFLRDAAQSADSSVHQS